MPKRRFEFKDTKSQKFWEINQRGKKYTVQYGRIGTDGQTRTKEFDSSADAKAAAEKLIAEKTRKGYAEAGTRTGGARSKKKSAVANTSSTKKRAKPLPKSAKNKATTKKKTAATKKTANRTRVPPKLKKTLDDVSKNCLFGQPVPDELYELWKAKLIGPRNQIHFPLHNTGFKLVSRYGKDFFLGYDDDNATCRGYQQMFREVAFIGAEDDGGLVGFWIYKPGLAVEKAPVVMLDTEGTFNVVAATLADYFVQAPWDNNHLKIKYTRGWFSDRGIKTRATAKAIAKAVEKMPDPNERLEAFLVEMQGSDDVPPNVLGKFEIRAGETALTTAASQNDDKNLQKFLTAGADPNKTNSSGTTPLHYACMFDKEAVVPLLLKAGANPNARDGDGRTPLHHVRANTKIVKMLLKAGADLEAKDNNGETHFISAVNSAWEAEGIAMLRFLIKQGIDITAKDRWGGSPIDYCEDDAKKILTKAIKARK